MERQMHADLVINGVATAAGGRYEKVKIDGVGKVEGDLHAAEFKLNGMATVRGNAEIQRLDVYGKLRVDGRLAAGASQFDGFVDVRDAVTGEHLTLKGLVKVKGDCELERFDAEGGFRITGLLNAGFINMRLHDSAKARDIGCESIVVRRGSKSQWKQMLRKVFTSWAPALETTTIEGDEIDLEHTTASVVRGNRVTLGPGCSIGRVEYRTYLRKHPAARVGEERKSGDGSHYA